MTMRISASSSLLGNPSGQSSTRAAGRQAVNIGSARALGLLLRRQEPLDAAQREIIAGDRKPGDDALADRRGLRCRAAADRVGALHLDRRDFDLAQRRDDRRIPRAERAGVEYRRVKTTIIDDIE